MDAFKKFSALPWEKDLMTREQKWKLKQEQAETMERIKQGSAIGLPLIFLATVLVSIFVFNVDILQIFKENLGIIIKCIATVILVCFGGLIGIFSVFSFMTPYFSLTTDKYKTKDEAIRESCVEITVGILAIISVAITFSYWADLMGM